VHHDRASGALGRPHDGVDIERRERAQVDHTDARAALFEHGVRGGERDVDHRAPT